MRELGRHRTGTSDRLLRACFLAGRHLQFLPCFTSPLPLLVLGILADDIDAALAPDEPALGTPFADGRAHFHSEFSFAPCRSGKRFIIRAINLPVQKVLLTWLRKRQDQRFALGSRRPSGLRKTTITLNSLAHRTTWLRSDFGLTFIQNSPLHHAEAANVSL